jgi:hypothetical protein
LIGVLGGGEDFLHWFLILGGLCVIVATSVQERVAAAASQFVDLSWLFIWSVCTFLESHHKDQLRLPTITFLLITWFLRIS